MTMPEGPTPMPEDLTTTPEGPTTMPEKTP